MGVTGFSFEFTSPVAPSRMFKASVLDACNLAPKILPEVISSAALVHGDGGVGSVKQYKFTSGLNLTVFFSSFFFLFFNTFLAKSKTHVLCVLAEHAH